MYDKRVVIDNETIGFDLMARKFSYTTTDYKITPQEDPWIVIDGKDKDFERKYPGKAQGCMCTKFKNLGGNPKRNCKNFGGTPTSNSENANCLS